MGKLFLLYFLMINFFVLLYYVNDYKIYVLLFIKPQ